MKEKNYKFFNNWFKLKVKIDKDSSHGFLLRPKNFHPFFSKLVRKLSFEPRSRGYWSYKIDFRSFLIILSLILNHFKKYKIKNACQIKILEIKAALQGSNHLKLPRSTWFYWPDDFMLLSSGFKIFRDSQEIENFWKKLNIFRLKAVFWRCDMKGVSRGTNVSKRIYMYVIN